MAEALLQITGLEKEFPGVKALKGVQLTVNKGEVHALMGENGAGKSTLIKVLTGIYQKTKGTIIFDGKEIDCKTPIEANAVGISTIYQELNLSPFQTVYENLFLGRELTGVGGKLDRKKMIAEAEKTLADLGLTVDVCAPLKTFPTAIQQMVAIARAVNTDCKMVIMDEPTSSLEPKEVEVLFRIIRQLKSRGIAVVFISHKLNEIFTICDRMTIFRDGTYVGDYDVATMDQFRLINLMVGKETKVADKVVRKYEYADKAPLLEVKNIQQGLRLNGVSMNIKPGEVVGLSGLLGSGRTELCNVIFGVTQPDSGEILWEGKPVKIANPAQAIAMGMGYCTEDRKTEGIVPHMSVKENMTIAMLPQLQHMGFVKTKEQVEIVDSYIKKLAVKTPTREQLICNLSGGNQQKVLLGRWMCMNPKLMILDEPTRGIDIGAKLEIEQLIQELSSHGVAVLMISSEMSELERNCDRIFVMREGVEVGELIEENVDQKKIMEAIAKSANQEVKN